MWRRQNLNCSVFYVNCVVFIYPALIVFDPIEINFHDMK